VNTQTSSVLGSSAHWHDAHGARTESEWCGDYSVHYDFFHRCRNVISIILRLLNDLVAIYLILIGADWSSVYNGMGRLSSSPAWVGMSEWAKWRLGIK
jgi:hypothetical protein